MTTTDKIEYYKKLLELERRTLASVTEQRDRLAEELNESEEEYGLWWAQKRIAIDERDEVREQRDEFRGLLIELYNDINVIHSGKAVSKLNKLFRDENYN